MSPVRSICQDHNQSMQLASRMSRLGTETAFEVLARARALEAAGREVVHLEIGEPDFDTPGNVIEAGVQAMRGGQTHYGPAAGLPALREAIAAEVAFPIYESMVKFLGGKVVPAVLRESNDFSLDVAELTRLVTPRTRLLILNAPGNPCGGILSRSDVEAVAELMRRNPQMWCLTDEIYGRILYEGELCSVFSHADLRDRTILLDGFSKAYAMTGWRLGYGVMPPQFAQHVTRLQINATSCTATFVQLAGVEALTGPQDTVAKMVAEFRRRRDVIVQELGSIPGFSCRVPKGAFYVFPNIQRTGKSSKDVERIMLDEGGVAGLSGTAFGSAGEGYVRFSYANSVDNIRKAMTKLRQVFRG